MAAPLHQVEAELFLTLEHPVRIRVFELLQDVPTPVRDLRTAIEVGAVEPVTAARGSASRRAGVVLA